MSKVTKPVAAQLEPRVLTLGLGLFAGFASFAPASFSGPWETDPDGLHYLRAHLLSAFHLGSVNGRRRGQRKKVAFSMGTTPRLPVLQCWAPLRHGSCRGVGGLLHCSDSSQPHSSLPFSPRPRGGDSFPFVANPWVLHCPLNSAQNCARCLPETLFSQVHLSVFSLRCWVLTVPGTSLLPWAIGSILLQL